MDWCCLTLGSALKTGIPDNLEVSKGTWNDRMLVETAFSLLTVVCQGKKMFHRDSGSLGSALGVYRRHVQCFAASFLAVAS